MALRAAARLLPSLQRWSGYVPPSRAYKGATASLRSPSCCRLIAQLHSQTALSRAPQEPLAARSALDGGGWLCYTRAPAAPPVAPRCGAGKMVRPRATATPRARVRSPAAVRAPRNQQVTLTGANGDGRCSRSAVG